MRSKIQDRRASAEFPEAKRLLGAVANSRGHRHEENVGRLVQVAKALPIEVGAALLASAEGYTPRATSALDRAREELGETTAIANALADNLPAPKAPARKQRRRRKRKKSSEGQAQQQNGQPTGTESSANGSAAAPGESQPSDQPSRSRRRRRRKPSSARASGTANGVAAPSAPSESVTST